MDVVHGHANAGYIYMDAEDGCLCVAYGCICANDDGLDVHDIVQ